MSIYLIKNVSDEFKQLDLESNQILSRLEITPTAKGADIV